MGRLLALRCFFRRSRIFEQNTGENIGGKRRWADWDRVKAMEVQYTIRWEQELLFFSCVAHIARALFYSGYSYNLLTPLSSERNGQDPAMKLYVTTKTSSYNQKGFGWRSSHVIPQSTTNPDQKLFSEEPIPQKEKYNNPNPRKRPILLQ